MAFPDIIEQAFAASLVEVQKLRNFLQAAGEPLNLKFTKVHHGPYADNLRHVLSRLEGHYIFGFGDDTTTERDAGPIRLLPGSADEAASVLRDHPATTAHIGQVPELASGFESAYGMELLATVHWIVSHDPRAGDAGCVTELVQHWNARKGRMFTRDHVGAALSHLHAYTWLFPDESTN